MSNKIYESFLKLISVHKRIRELVAIVESTSIGVTLWADNWETHKVGGVKASDLIDDCVLRRCVKNKLKALLKESENIFKSIPDENRDKIRKQLDKILEKER